MTLRTLCLDIADAWDRWMQRYGLRICVALIAGALVIGLLFVGPVTNEDRAGFVTVPSAVTNYCPAEVLP